MNCRRLCWHGSHCSHTMFYYLCFWHQPHSDLHLSFPSVYSSRRTSSFEHSFCSRDLKKSLNKWQLTWMRAVWCHVQFVRNAHWWGNLFSPWKPLQVNYEDFWEPKYGDRLVHSINSFAFGALVSTFFHSLGTYKIIKTIRYTRGWPGYLDWQIHEIIEGQTFMAAFLALYHAHQLTFKEIRYYRVVSISKIPVPNLRLFYHGLFFAVNLLILRLLSNSVQLIMHSVE